MGTESRQERERQEKWERRADSFFGAFRMTENGRPKSGFGVYTFSLSIAYAAVYFFCYEAAIRLLAGPVSGMSVTAGNFLTMLCAVIPGVCLTCVWHRIFGDKRLCFGAHLWLCGYAVAVLLIMLVLLGAGNGMLSFLIFFAWFVLPPVAAGICVSYLLYRRDHRPEERKEPEPEWKKYTRRS